MPRRTSSGPYVPVIELRHFLAFTDVSGGGEQVMQLMPHGREVMLAGDDLERVSLEIEIPENLELGALRVDR